ncbi:MAG TPA: teichoic acid glycosylation protein [Syntrophomonas sp.]|jgi:putative flippase GtrA|nr:teichoic acid glycosylation protein [Syntrophomonas sp.]
MQVEAKYQKYKILVLYLGYGGLTTLINILAYSGLAKLAGLPYLKANLIAWILSVLFAYATNHLFVFESKARGLFPILGQCLAFFGCRLFSGLLDMTIMYVMIDVLHSNDLLTKIISNIIVVISNYLFSKHIVFQDKGQGEVL